MLHRVRVFLLALTLLLAAAARADDPRMVEFEAFVNRIMEAQRMPGLSVAVTHGDFRWERGFGFSDLENHVVATADTSYRMGSVSKPMTAIAALNLMEEGKLDLDAEVQRYVEYFPRKPQPVTVRQLLAHQCLPRAVGEVRRRAGVELRERRPLPLRGQALRSSSSAIPSRWRCVPRGEEDAPLLDALQAAYVQGLAYYDRHGKAMTADARELDAAFRFLREGKNLGDGAHPVAGEPLVKIGSYIASVLRDSGRYHREGALRFFADYARTRKHELDAKTAARVKQWNEEWSRVWNAELAALTFWEEDPLAVLERNREAFFASSVRPDYERMLAFYAEGRAEQAERAKALSAALYR